MPKDYISQQLLTTSINIHSSRLRGNINETILRQLKNRFEGVCNQDGYIEKDSIEIVNRSIGEVTSINNKSYIVYNITYKANVISPSNGDKLPCTINAVSKVGVIGFIKDKEEHTMSDSPFVIMVPKEYFESDEVIESLVIGSRIDVVIEAFRVKYLSNQIQVVAKPV